jgi:MFS family permease
MRSHVSQAVDPLSLPNNAASWWFRDPGMRALTWPILVGFASTISSGYDGSCMTGLQANKRYFMPAIGNPDANKLGLIVAAYTLGALPGLLPASYMADRWGRRVSLAVGCVVIIAGALVQALTTGGWNMFAGRFIVGLGGIVASISGSPYATEVAHPRNRAQVGALTNTSWWVLNVAG